MDQLKGKIGLLDLLPGAVNRCREGMVAYQRGSGWSSRHGPPPKIPAHNHHVHLGERGYQSGRAVRTFQRRRFSYRHGAVDSLDQ